MKEKRNQNGYALLSILAYSTAISLVLVYFLSAFSSAKRAERGLSSDYDLDQMGHSIRLMTEREDACRKTGLVGVDVSSLLGTSTGPVSVVLSPSGKASKEAFALGPGSLFGARRIEEFQITKLNEMSEGFYLAELSLKTSIVGKATTVKNPNQTFLLGVNVDPKTQKISKCSARTQPTPVLGCATASFNHNGIRGSSQRKNVPDSIAYEDIFEADPYNGAPLSASPSDSWGASCKEGWQRTNCSGAGLGEERNSLTGQPGNLSVDADIALDNNGCYGDNEEAYGVSPTISIVCCRIFAE